MRKATIRDCIKVDLIENLVMTDAVEGVTAITELTDGHVESWYE